ncbi:MAG: hypothetical protein GC159_09250 [Phycisphaera sp.]|nr:hypothetical protein [Phycisphaera sp.]
MRILLGLAILITLALAASSRKLWSLRRTRLGTALTTGGWLMIAIGMMIGPHGAELITHDQLEVVKPLILFCLGWVGLMIGLQAHRSVFTKLPPLVTRVALVDVALSVLFVGGATLAVVMAFDQPLWAAMPVALVMGVCGVSWSAEVRSLAKSPMQGQAVTGVMRGASGLGSIFAVLAYALLVNSFVISAYDSGAGGALVDTATEQAITWSVLRMGIGIGASLLIGTAMGVLGLWLSKLAGRGEGEFLVVLLGLVSFTAGAAATMGYSALFVSMLTGAVLVNLPGKALDRIKRVIIEAEQPLAMVLMLVAGVLTDPAVFVNRPKESCALIAAVLAARAVTKLGGSRWQVRRGLKIEAGAPTPSLVGLIRQAPLAIALAAGYALSQVGRADQSALRGDEVLMLVIVCGLIAEAGPFFHKPNSPAKRDTPPAKPTSTPATGAPPSTPDAPTEPEGGAA